MYSDDAFLVGPVQRDPSKIKLTSLSKSFILLFS